jgi:hypothetical protein
MTLFLLYIFKNKNAGLRALLPRQIRMFSSLADTDAAVPVSRRIPCSSRKAITTVFSSCQAKRQWRSGENYIFQSIVLS